MLVHTTTTTAPHRRSHITSPDQHHHTETPPAPPRMPAVTTETLPTRSRSDWTETGTPDCTPDEAHPTTVVNTSRRRWRFATPSHQEHRRWSSTPSLGRRGSRSGESPTPPALPGLRPAATRGRGGRNPPPSCVTSKRDARVGLFFSLVLSHLEAHCRRPGEGGNGRRARMKKH